MRVLALIGDVVGSRQLDERGAFQRKLLKTLKTVNADNSALASPYTITLGDEFQAVYLKADTLFVDLFTIMSAIYPVRVRFAIGIGGLTTRINRKQALGMDGVAFYRAREAITYLKDTPYFLHICGGTQAPWKLLGHALDFISHQVQSWEQNRIMILRGLLRGESVSKLERQLRISRVAIYKNINAAALDELHGMYEELTGILNQELKAP